MGLALLLVAPASAVASGAFISTSAMGDVLQVVGGQLNRDNLKVTRVDADTFQVDELRPDGPTLSASSAKCRNASQRRVLCDSTALALVHIDLLGFDDSFSAAGTLPRTVVLAGGGDDNVSTGPGNDRIEGGDGGDTVFAGAGADELVGGDGSDILTGESGVDNVSGGSAKDVIITRESALAEADNVFCGGGIGEDEAELDLKDNMPANDCESVDRSPVKDPVNVAISSRSLRLREDVVAVRVRCPRAIRRCTGRLSLLSSRRIRTGGRRRIVRFGSRRYTIRSGSRRVVSVPVSKGAQRLLGRLRRVRVEVRSVESGPFGPRTTIRTVGLKMPSS